MLEQPQYSKAIAVSFSSPPVPEKLAKRAWQGEYQDLLPAGLGAPSPTVLDSLTNAKKVKCKKSIETTYCRLGPRECETYWHGAPSSLSLAKNTQATHDVAFGRQAA